MGGRGAAGGFVPRLPRKEKAFIHDNKITKFLLLPGAKHYKEFERVGYTPSDKERLRNDILAGLEQNEAKYFEPNKHGDTAYQVNMRLGISKKRWFVTAWQIDKGTDFPRFITAHMIGDDDR